ncbi:MAG: hypothetical protein KGO05_11890, partial [Chloroflexota bacterium]|nr:hypothetical protein [Chloroflexota bacterium]
ALIIMNRPWNVIGRLLVAIGLGTTITYFSAAYTQYHVESVSSLLPAARYIDWLGNVVWPCNMALGLFILFLFPTGRPLTPRWRWLIWVGAIGLLCMALSAAFMPGPFEGETTINPFGVDALAGPLKLLGAISGPLMFFLALATVYSVVLRFWRSHGDERQMLKWFAFCVAVMAIGFAANLFLLPPNDPFLGSLGFAIAFGSLPVGIVTAVLRFHLYDIDLIINRTLVYGSLTALLAGIYFGLVILSQRLAVPLTGSAQQSPIVIVLSTLVIASLFQPLRRRIQRVIDHRFYRRKYDAARTLAAFGKTLRTEVELAALSDELLTVVEETMQPRHVSLWLRPTAERGR